MPAAVSRGRGRRTINEINMVPFIDVMLVLLIIFMVTAPMLSPSMINLPTVGKGSTQPAQVISIMIDKDGALSLKSSGSTRPIKQANIAEAVLKLQEGQSDSAVVISADRTLQYDSVLKVMSELQDKGVKRVGLAVQVGR